MILFEVCRPWTEVVKDRIVTQDIVMLKKCVSDAATFSVHAAFNFQLQPLLDELFLSNFFYLFYRDLKVAGLSARDKGTRERTFLQVEI